MQKYQQRLYFLLFFSAIFNAFLALIPNVALYVPEFECDLKDVLNVSVQDLQVSKAFFIEQLTLYIYIQDLQLKLSLKNKSFEKLFKVNFF